METKKLTLTFVKSFPKTSISGENYTSVSIKSKEYGDKYLSGFGNKDNQNWKVGDVVEVLVKQVLKDGKEYLNFEMPKNVTKSQNNSEVLHQIEVLKTKISRLSALIERLYEKSFGEDLEGYPIEDIKAEDITFDQK